MNKTEAAFRILHLILSVLTLVLFIGALYLLLFVPYPWGLAKNHQPGHIGVDYIFLEGLSKGCFTEEELPIAVLVLGFSIIGLVLIAANTVMTFKKAYGTARRVICLSATVSLAIAATSVFVLSGIGYLCTIPAVIVLIDGFLFFPKVGEKTFK